MKTAAEHLDDALKELESERDRINDAIGDLRTVITKLKNGATPQSKGARDRKGFERKYEKPARDLVESIIPEGGPAMTAGQIKNSLMAQGYAFQRGTINLTIRHLLEDKTIVQQAAPKGSGFQYAYFKVSQAASAHGLNPSPGREG